MADTLKIKTEKEYISLLLSNLDNAEDWLSSPLDAEYFDPMFKLLLSCVKESTKDSLVVTKRQYEQFYKKFLPSKMDWIAQDSLFHEISKLYVDKNDYLVIKKKIVENYRSDKMSDALQDYRKNTLKFGGEFATKKLGETIQGINVSISVAQSKIAYKAMQDVGMEYNEIIKERLVKGEQAYVKCYIEEIDHITGKGFAPGTLTLFCADVSGFKSGMMLNVGANIWKMSKKNVLYVPLEMTRHETYERMCSRETKIKMYKIQKPHLLTPEELETVKEFPKMFEQQQSDFNAKFYVMQPSCRIDTKTVEAEIQKYIQIFNPDAIIIDYIANLVADKGASKQKRSDEEIGDILKNLRTMGKPGAVSEKGFAVISGAQIGRQALKRVRKSGKAKVSFNSEDIRDSHSYAADADTIFAQMYDPQNNNRLLLFAIKGRHGGTLFPNNNNMATLDLQRDICLVQSISSDYFSSSNKNSILDMLQSASKTDFSITSEDFTGASDQDSLDGFKQEEKQKKDSVPVNKKKDILVQTKEELKHIKKIERQKAKEVKNQIPKVVLTGIDDIL